MSLIGLVIVLIVIGVLLWYVQVHLPIDATIKKIIHAVVILAVILWLLSVFGILDSVNSVKVPRG